jgi:hypothetical protein
VLGWTLPLALIVGRQGGRRVSASQWAFLALWLLPGVAFAIAVHVADAGQTLAIVPGVCLLGGHVLSRAGEEIERRPSTLARAGLVDDDGRGGLVRAGGRRGRCGLRPGWR